jgi:hypothetical protein
VTTGQAIENVFDATENARIIFLEMYLKLWEIVYRTSEGNGIPLRNFSEEFCNFSKLPMAYLYIGQIKYGTCLYREPNGAKKVASTAPYWKSEKWGLFFLKFFFSH